MKNIKLTKNTIYNIVSIVILVAVLFCLIVEYQYSIGRFVESVRDFGESIGYYFCEMFGIEHNIKPHVNDLAKIPFFDFSSSPATPPSAGLLPQEQEEAKSEWTRFWQAFGSKDNFLAYSSSFLSTCIIITQISSIFVMFFVVLGYSLQRTFYQSNNNYNGQTKSLKCGLWLADNVYHPIKDWLVGFYRFFVGNKVYKTILILLLALMFNAIVVVFELIAYYYYFIISFDFGTMYRQFYKLFLDLSVLTKIPVLLWCVVVIFILHKLRVKMAYATLQHNEMKNRGFINSLPIVSMLVGEMGAKKTTLAVDMAISQNIMMRDKALEKLLDASMLFPHFPWINLELELQRAVRYHQVYNLVTCEDWIIKRVNRSIKNDRSLFDYDLSKYDVDYDDCLQMQNLTDVLIKYSKLYFIYFINTSYVQSNLSIRLDDIAIDKGNFPLWDTDIFMRDSINQDKSFYAHILNFDSVRLGRKVISDSKDMFEFGTVVITEIGKERQNSKELQGVKKQDDETNQKNDMFNSWLKMCRHSSTVDNYPFIKVFCDEQRPESLGADVRDLANIVHILDAKDERNALVGWWIDDLVYNVLFSSFVNKYLKYRHNRSDDSLMMHIMTVFVSKIYNYHLRKRNTFLFYKCKLGVEKGIQDGNVEKHNYYLSSKKTYSNRFSTDCFRDYFADLIGSSGKGLVDMTEYVSTTASLDELRSQNSYFIRDLDKWKSHPKD